MQVAIPDTLRCVAHLTRGEEQLINVWHFRKNTAGSPSEAAKQDVLLGLQTFYGGPVGAAIGIRGIRDWIDASVNIERFTAQWIDSVPYDDPSERSFNMPGTGTADALPLQTSLCVSLRTGVSSRRARGRLYLGGFTVEANDEPNAPGNARPASAFLTDVNEAFTDLLDYTDGLGIGWQLGVVSELDQVCRGITSIKIKNVWSTQRRRAKSVPVTSSTLVLQP